MPLHATREPTQHPSRIRHRLPLDRGETLQAQAGMGQEFGDFSTHQKAAVFAPDQKRFKVFKTLRNT
jgi:hypothetical protein